MAIDGTKVQAQEGMSLLQAADAAGFYIPRLCSHPDLPPFEGLEPRSSVYRGEEHIEGNGTASSEGCQLCLVEIESEGDLRRACATPAAEGMSVYTNSSAVQEARRDHLVSILAKHPHACLTCAQREGCSREPCSTNVPVEERCCPKFGNCELQRVAEYIGIREETPRYIPQGIPLLRDDPLFLRDYNLCIGCTRCVRACGDLRGVEALGFVCRDGEVVVGTVGPSLRESACKFCTACVEVCPTGALMDKRDDTAVIYKTGEDFGELSRAGEAALVPCRATCPAGVDVPRYLRLVAEGKPAEAAAVVREQAPFPAVLGHVCFHPCEDACRRGQVNEPVAICALKRFAAERERELKEPGKLRETTSVPSGKSVAIVGSGPAGLTAAYYLAGKGHTVTLFEAAPEPGGMMRYGIPQYRLPRQVLQQEIDDILEQGVELRTNTRLGEDISLDQLKAGYDAVFLAVGAQQSRRLKIEGVELDDVLWGVDFLRAVNSGQDVPVRERVVVIGGGGVAVDVALTALRLGAREVQLACLESREEMPAHEWEIEEAVEEGVTLHPSWGPRRILGKGRVSGIELVRCISVFDEKGRFNPSYDEAVTTALETDMVILAIGQSSDLSFLGEDSGVKCTEGGTIEIDPDTLETSVAGLFAAGEVVSGPTSVVEAIAAGRKAAAAIDSCLGGDGEVIYPLIESEEPNPWLGREEGFADRPRAAMPCLPVVERLGGFAQIELGFDGEMAVAEGSRCLQCDLRLKISAVAPPPEKWLEFSAENVNAVPEVEGVYQLRDEDQMVMAIVGTMNLRQALQEQLSAGVEARYFEYEEDPMYTKRESELIQQFLQQYGRLPEGAGEDLDDLF